MNEDKPLRVRDALATGLTPSRLRGRAFAHPFHGVVAPATARPAAETYAPLLRPGDRFSGVTALELLGAPIPAVFAGAVDVTAGPGLGRPRSRGVVGHRADDRIAVLTRHGPCSPPARAFIEAARVLEVDALIKVGDHLVLVPRFGEPHRPFTDPHDLTAAAAERTAGAVRARLAIPQIRLGVESPKETELRLLLIRAGLPEPICGYEVPGIGWFDLAWPDRMVLGEYDGDQHRSSVEQYERDMLRYELAAAAGWHIVRVRMAGLRRSGHLATVARFAAALHHSEPKGTRRGPREMGRE